MMIALPPTIFVTPRKWSKPQSDPFNRATQAVDDPDAKRRPQLLQILQQLPFASKDHVQLLRNLQQLRRPPSVIRKPRTTAARALAEQEYAKYRRTLDTQSSPVEGHFDEAVKKAKQLAQPKKKTGKKTEDGK